MKSPSLNLSIALAALFLAACGGTPTQKSPTPISAGSANADELAASALLTWGNDRGKAPQALGQVQRAVQSAPQRPELLWLYLRLCADTATCEAEVVEAQLRKLDPGSGAVWLGALTRAQARNDSRTEDQILEVMGKSAHFNVYWTTLIAQLTPPISRSPVASSVAQPTPTPVTNALNMSIEYLSRLTTPAFTALSTACDARHVREPDRRVRCERISRILQGSDTTLAEGLGLGIAQRVALPSSTAVMQITAKINTLSYQNQTAGTVVASQVEKDKFSDQMLKLMARLDREQEVSKAILRWAGRPLQP
ncbi:MAG: hypothetical protein ABW171_09210 [Steroidobacter sp.]